MVDPSNLLFGYYLRSLIEKNGGERPQNERRQKSPRKKSRLIINTAIVACGRLFVTIGIRLQLMVWSREQEEASEGPACSYEQ